MADYLSRPRGLTRRFRRLIGWTHGGLWVEALLAALWPVFTVLCLTLAFVTAGGLELMDPLGHRIALGVAGVAALAALGYGFWGFRAPQRAAAVQRLDRTDGMRPLSTLTDSLAATGSSAARAIWFEHQRRAELAAERMRAARPDLRLSSRDRWALRLFAVALLTGALLTGGDRAAERLEAALEPGAVGPAAETMLLAEPGIEAWAVPPAYTGADTVLLSRRGPDAGPLTLPQGTEITIRATGMAEAPALAAPGLDPAPGFVALGGGLFETTGTLARSGTVTVGAPDAPMAAWQIAMTPDAPPEIEATAPPRAAVTRALEVAFAARDDYGVVAAWAEIDLAEKAEQRMEVEPIEFALPLPISGDPREVADIAMRDLTDHPWAGAEVLLTLHAEDAAGQRTVTEPIRMTLPERRFTDPLARALAEQRRELIVDYGHAERVLDTVQAVTRVPDAVFDDHVGAYLAVRTAMRRLAPALVDERLTDEAPDVAEFLWRAALALESGDMASALERLREAEERLRSALESGTDEEIAAAIDELRQAINEYLEEMMRQALQNPEMMEQMQQQGQQGQELSRQDLQDLLDQLQNQAESGLRDQAREMLSELSRMLENLQAGRMQPGQNPGEQALQQLQEMIQRQQGLADETFDQLRQQRRQGQQGQQGQQPGQQGQSGQQGQGQQPGQGQPQQGGQAGEGGNRAGSHSENGRLAAEQEALRRAIEELRNQLGGGEGMDGASRALDEAGRSMGQARDDLEGNATGDALQDQMDALDALNEGAQSLAEAIQNGQGQTGAEGRRDGPGRAQDQQAMDPFDRPAGTYGAIDGSSTEVPNRALVDRARELLEELRRRSADQARPEIELRYLERLLEQF